MAADGGRGGVGREHRGTAVVTGGARRIGRAIALDLAGRGFDVAVHCNESTDEAEAVADLIRGTGARAVVVRADLGDLAAVARIVPEAAAALGPVTMLVNNASMFVGDTPETLQPALFLRQMTVNLAAPCFLARDLAGRLPADRTGLVVNLIDQRVLKPTPQFFSYTLSKSALFDATRTLAQALAPWVRVNGIGPGPTLPNVRQSDDDFARQSSAVLLGRGPALSEITGAIGFLLETPSVTGQMLALDGGQHLAWQTPDVVGINE
ncbi:SDR family oxidoreductase [Methylobrevis albus]|uniref:SDR family oxidoreductase n=1 Tax=Methylobrevis albus TaxID=2793297 RepID=A0A931I425_9HYPH|nr:SDR family oxidoreductase [Methylobrevis albus]MBH0238506.1 SDR family oxidoreductase [Methylobrevis albus]